ncbi:MAG: sugar-binding transcriptional regulator [Chloroflexota bacterium]|nr:sugar-binding transcriptional regulator [Chloroflexota bacterium]
MSLPKDSQLLRSCYLFYRENMTMQEIAKQLHISRFKVSRYIKEAVEKGIVQVHFRDSNIEHEKLALQLEQSFPIKLALVVPTPYRSDISAVRLAVGQAGASLLADIKPETSLSITWGRTIAHLVENLPSDQLKAQRVVDLAGGFGEVTDEISARAVTLQIARKLNAECFQLPAPTIVENIATAHALLQEPIIRKTLRIASESDIAIMGVGPTDVDSLLYRSGYVSEIDFAYLKDSNAVGSIFGRFYDLNGRECDTEFRERAIALSFDDLRKIPERMALTMGSHRIQAILGLMYGELITTLVTDSDTATAVLEEHFTLQAERSGKGTSVTTVIEEHEEPSLLAQGKV